MDFSSIFAHAESIERQFGHCALSASAEISATIESCASLNARLKAQHIISSAKGDHSWLDDWVTRKKDNAVYDIRLGIDRNSERSQQAEAVLMLFQVQEQDIKVNFCHPYWKRRLGADYTKADLEALLATLDGISATVVSGSAKGTFAVRVSLRDSTNDVAIAEWLTALTP